MEITQAFGKFQTNCEEINSNFWAIFAIVPEFLEKQKEFMQKSPYFG